MLAACGNDKAATSDSTSGNLDGLDVVTDDSTDLPIAGLSSEQRSRFLAGDAKFDEPTRETQGLGPLYIRTRCTACHQDDSRGPESVTKFAFVEADGVTPSAEQSPFGHTVRTELTSGAVTGITAPAGAKITKRFGPPVFGRGYIEAISASAIEDTQVAQASRDDGISGEINYVQGGLIGRFGMKARSPSIDDFAADAYQSDLGMTSPLRPNELGNPDGITDDGKPGLDVDQDQLDTVADYVRVLAIPPRQNQTDEGRALFDSVRCSVCHVPSQPTRNDYPIPQLAGIDAPVFSDVLLHDMGDALADGIVEELATSREWRTAPLMGLRHFRNYLHDGRAGDIDSAIRAHQSNGSEANDSIQRYSELNDENRATLLSFVEGL